MDDWMILINAHIHMKYVFETHIKSNFWDTGTVEIKFFKVTYYVMDPFFSVQIVLLDKHNKTNHMYVVFTFYRCVPQQ